MAMLIRNLVRDEAGATTAEYALILALFGSGITGAAFLLGDAIGGSMKNAGDEIVDCTLVIKASVVGC